MIRVGYCFLVIGVVLLSPLPDLLPVETWVWLKGLFSQGEPPHYYRVVPAEDNRSVSWSAGLIAIGLLLVWRGKLAKRRG